MADDPATCLRPHAESTGDPLDARGGEHGPVEQADARRRLVRNHEARIGVCEAVAGLAMAGLLARRVGH
jgi:hypothetical protein